MAFKRLLQASAVIALLAAPTAIAAQDPAPAPVDAPVPATAPPATVLQTPVAEDETTGSDAVVAQADDAAAEDEFQDEAMSPAEIERAQDRCKQRYKKAMRRCGLRDLECRSGAKSSLRACMSNAQPSNG